MLRHGQLALIADLVMGDKDERAVLEDHGVLPRLYHKWLGQEAFVEELERVQEVARQRHVLRLARHTPTAVDGLVRMMKEGSGEVVRKVCLDLLSVQGPGAKDGAGSRAPRAPRMTKGQASRILKVLAENDAG